MDPREDNARKVLAIHRQMRIDTRRFAAAVETATEADRQGRLQPLAKWAAGFGRELDLHHHIEDDLLFPRIVARVPEVGLVLEGLAADHEVVAGILERWTPAARRLADPTVPFAPAREVMLHLATELRDLLAEHLDVEDELILPRLPDAFTPEEMLAWEDELKKFIPKTGVSFALPWNVHALPVEERADMLRLAPWFLRVLYRLHAGRFDRLVDAAFAGVPTPVVV